ncbi:MAG: molybdopterin dinucleotide binding domain-containing protein, partial [Dehalococcoidia bacterium]|nr:molybdopterin dinucleotide binding domain-containing protein [Dehalococcoidia bacterium]
PFDEGDSENLALDGTFNVEGNEVRPAFQLLKEHVKEYIPSWASNITGISEETIRRIAKEFTENARIGSEIVIEGARMPYRPVAIVMGKSVNNGVGGYEAVWLQHVLITLVGALEVAGGLLGQQVVINPTPIKNDGDGFIHYPVFPTDPERWSWPPKSRDAWNILMPFIGREPSASGPYGPCHLGWMMQKNPPKELPPISPPEVWFTYRTNPVVSMWDCGTVISVVERIPFQVSFGYELDETNHFADIILPENNDLESLFMYPIGGQKQWESFWEYTGFAIRQPVVKPLYDTRELTDIFTEIAERVGFLSEYNDAINQGCGINSIRLKTSVYDYSLELSKKYSSEEIYDRLFRAATMWLTDGKEERGLEWFKENGAFLIPFSKVSGLTRGNVYRRPWFLHPTMREKGLRYNLPYQEQIKRVGEELGQRLHEKGINWWDSQLSEYTPLAEWRDFPAAYDTGPDFDLWLICCRSMQYSLGANASLPLMFEAAQNVLGHTGAMINSRTAKAKRIKNGDLIWMESAIGRVQGRACVREGVHPDVVVTTQQFGQWKIAYAKDLGWPCLNPITPITLKTTNSSGSSTDQVKVKIYKV